MKQAQPLSIKTIVTGFILLVFCSTATVAESQTLKKHNPANFISVTTLKYRMEKDKQLVVVDIRTKKEFGQVNIPGSMNIPLYAIKTKMFLKSRPLVLVNNGFRYSILSKECESLKKSGFNVSILSGGLTGWQAFGNNLAGDPLKARSINRISPSDLYLEKEYQNIRVIDLSKTADASFQETIKAVHLPYKSGDKATIKQLSSVLENKNKLNPFSLALANASGENYNVIEKQLAQSGIQPLFFLEGGSTAYMDFLAKHTRMHATRSQRIKTVQGCSTCGDEVKD